MTRVLAAAVLVILLAACAPYQSHPATARPSPLQRFNDLRAILAGVDAASGKVAADVLTANRRMQGDDVRGAQVAAVALKRDALLLQRRSGRAAARVRPLAAGASNPAVRHYFALADDVLASQWAEGHDLTYLADLVWADPLLLSPADVAKLEAIQGKARRAAAAAAGAAAAARAWRHAHSHAFRYIPVRQAT